MPHIYNLVVRFNAGNCILKRVFIDPTGDVSILYHWAFIEVELYSSMMNPPISTLKYFDNSLADILGTIHLPMKLGNNDEGFQVSEENFYVIDAPLRYNAVICTSWKHKMGSIPSTLYQVMKFPTSDRKSIMELYLPSRSH